ncbi:hypothetical protein KKE60_08085 [Patescibacteria group bacterium]|nr:hypothetical protein [Patescibacteria group bacterium]
MNEILKKLGLSVSLCALFMFGAITFACAEDSTRIEVSTYSITGASGTLTPNVADGLNLKGFVITNSSAVAQTVTFYELATATTTATKILDYIVPASIGTETVIFERGTEINTSDLMLEKSSTGSDVVATVLYD